MAKNIKIKEDGIEKSFNDVGVIITSEGVNGFCNWYPEDEIKEVFGKEIEIEADGIYEDDAKIGYKTVIVSVDIYEGGGDLYVTENDIYFGDEGYDSVTANVALVGYDFITGKLTRVEIINGIIVKTVLED